MERSLPCNNFLTMTPASFQGTGKRNNLPTFHNTFHHRCIVSNLSHLTHSPDRINHTNHPFISQCNHHLLASHQFSKLDNLCISSHNYSHNHFHRGFLSSLCTNHRHRHIHQGILNNPYHSNNHSRSLPAILSSHSLCILNSHSRFLPAILSNNLCIPSNPCL